MLAVHRRSDKLEECSNLIMPPSSRVSATCSRPLRRAVRQRLVCVCICVYSVEQDLDLAVEQQSHKNLVPAHATLCGHEHVVKNHMAD